MSVGAGPSRGAERQRAAAEKIVSVLRESGCTAYLAGGCVRDMLLGWTPKDYDVATDATPDRVVSLFRRTVLVGEAFGVALVRLMGCEVEVATFRIEWGYSDRRRPDHVAFTDAAHDARRRDFTINGLFYDPIERAVIDYVEGRADLEAGRVRAIGDPGQRFAEDYLRMLRAVRFAARLGFEIEPRTRRAIEKEAPRLGLISRERIGGEMRQMLTAVTRVRAAELCQSLALDAPALDDEFLPGGAAMLGEMPVDAGFALALAAWACDRAVNRAGSGATARSAVEGIDVERLVDRWRAALALSNDDRDRLASLLSRLPAALDWATLATAGRKRLIARAEWADLAALARAFGRVHGGFNEAAFEAEVARLEAEGVCPAPLVTGDDLIALGMKPGPVFKDVLEAVYDAQLEGRVAEREGAMAMVRSMVGAGE